MNTIRFEKIHEGKDVYVNDDMTKDNCLLRLWDWEQNPSLDVEKTLPFIDRIKDIVQDGTVLDCDNIIDEMEFLENGHIDGYLILHCSFEENFSNSFLVFVKIERKGEVGRIGKTKFYINSNEENHSYTPHFHVKDNDNNFSFCFDGQQLAGDSPNGTISKRIKYFLSSPDTLEKLKKEWNKNNKNIQMIIPTTQDIKKP